MVACCYLPLDLLRCVAARLGTLDQVRFRAVSTYWRKIGEVKPNDKFPWVFAPNESRAPDKARAHYYLYDLENKKSYSVQIDRKRWVSLGRLHSDNIFCIRSGWMLVKATDSEELSLFNPLTREVIELPPLQATILYAFSFRYSSKSKFMVYAIFTADDRIVINTWKSGDRDWVSNHFVPEFPNLLKSIMKIELVGEAMYAIFKSGVVGVFQDLENSWYILVKDDQLFSGLSDTLVKVFELYSRTFEFNGELFIFCVHDSRISDLWRLDCYNRCWVKTDEIHKCALFFSWSAWNSTVCSEKYVIDSDTATARLYSFNYERCRVVSKEYRRAPDRLVFDPYNLKQLRFPWDPSDFQVYWIEPSPFVIDRETLERTAVERRILFKWLLKFGWKNLFAVFLPCVAYFLFGYICNMFGHYF